LTERRTIGIVSLALIIGLFAGSFATYALMQWTARIPTTATLKLVGVGVYKDINFTVPVTQIDWGVLEPGQNVNFSAYIKNLSNVPITLTMYTESWTPANASSFISLSWDYSGKQINVSGSIPITFTLTIAPTTVGLTTFSFIIVIVGSG